MRVVITTKEYHRKVYDHVKKVSTGNGQCFIEYQNRKEAAIKDVRLVSVEEVTP